MEELQIWVFFATFISGNRLHYTLQHILFNLQLWSLLWRWTAIRVGLKLAVKHVVWISDCMHFYCCISHRLSVPRMLVWAANGKPEDRNQAVFDSAHYSAILWLYMEPDYRINNIQDSSAMSLLDICMQIHCVSEHVICRAPSSKHLKQQYTETIHITNSWDCRAFTILYQKKLYIT